MLIPRCTSILRLPINRIAACQSCVAKLSTSKLRQDSKTPEKDAVEEKPYPFMSKLDDKKFSAYGSFQHPHEETWVYQPYIILVGCFVFIMYFIVLRKENDIDESIAQVMYQTMPELEIPDLKKKIKRYEKMGLYTKPLEDRLKQLEKQE
ncbi:hypothetical protein ACF0H5_001868 [Mactra antiquata]